MSFLSGGGKVTVGYRYYMTLMMGLCRGPIDEIVEIKIGDRQAWPVPAGEKPAKYKDVPPIDDTMVTRIDAGNLFGGDKREGGIDGKLNVYMGRPNQTILDKFKTMIGGRVPDFRGVVTVWFDGLICSLNPYPKEWKFRVRRTTEGWNGPVWRPGLCVIWQNNHSIKAMNPAHILYETATNYDWGRGLNRNELDDKVWTESAQKLKNEKFGMCLKWSRDGDLDVFVTEILKHVGGSIYTDRATGLLCLRLIRRDYKYKNLPLYTYKTGLLEVSEDSTLMPDKTINEVVIKYHTPLGDADRSVRAQNLALIQSTGSRNSTETEYAGVAITSLATRLAQRDMRALAVTERYVVKLDRRAWSMYPGKAFRISAPDKGIENLVLRAGKMTYGTMTDGTITVEAVLDVFALSSAEFTTDSDPTWSLPDVIPESIDTRKVREATYYEFLRNADKYSFDNLQAPESAITVLAGRPAAMALNFEVWSRAGSAVYKTNGAGEFATTGNLQTGMLPYDTAVTLHNVVDGDSFDDDMFLEVDDEIMEVVSYTYDEDALVATMVVVRGIFDTIPAPHSIGTRFYISGDSISSDGREWITGDHLDVKLITITSSGELDTADAPVDSLIVAGRQGRPYPPGNVKINGTLFFDGVTNADPNNVMSLVPPLVNLTLTWTHRDRVTQSDTIIGHTDASVGPEAGVQYLIEIRNSSNTVVATATVTGTTWTYALSGLTAGQTYTLSLAAIRSSLQSTFVYRRKFSR